jgi:undecaprenyl-diphosphatase
MDRGFLPRAAWLLLVLSTAFSATSYAGGCSGDSKSGGVLGLDRCDEYEATGIYSRQTQKFVDFVVIGGSLGVAFWEGTDTRTGRTAWKAVDSMATAAVTTEIMKRVFQRPRPSQSDDPDLWRQGKGNASFPSGEVATMAAFVTPVILEYRDEYPAVWGLSVLPIYMANARMASLAHWTSDVIAGAAVGTVAGSMSFSRETPLVLSLTKDGTFIGFKHRF